VLQLLFYYFRIILEVTAPQQIQTHAHHAGVEKKKEIAALAFFSVVLETKEAHLFCLFVFLLRFVYYDSRRRHIFTLLSLSTVMRRVPERSYDIPFIPPSPLSVPGNDFVFVHW
jgi:hypothetical protein